LLELRTEFGCVHEVAIMSYREAVIPEPEIEWLEVLWQVRSRRGVAYVPDPYRPFEGCEGRLVEDFGNQPLTFFLVQFYSVIRGDARTLLPPVLESVQGIIDGN